MESTNPEQSSYGSSQNYVQANTAVFIDEYTQQNDTITALDDRTQCKRPLERVWHHGHDHRDFPKHEQVFLR